MNAIRFASLAALLGVLLGANPCRADQVLDLSGTVVTVGNTASNCNPNPCTIVTKFSFQMTFGSPELVSPAPGASAYLLPFTTTVSYTTLSSLGNSSASDLTALGSVDPVYLGFTSSGDYLIVPLPVGLQSPYDRPEEMDMDFALGATADGTVVFSGPYIQWYYCGGVCIQDFIQPQYQQYYNATVGGGGCFNFSCEADASSVQLLGFSAVLETPEPSSLTLLNFGAGLVFLLSLRAGGAPFTQFRVFRPSSRNRITVSYQHGHTEPGVRSSLRFGLIL